MIAATIKWTSIGGHIPTWGVYTLKIEKQAVRRKIVSLIFSKDLLPEGINIGKCIVHRFIKG